MHKSYINYFLRNAEQINGANIKDQCSYACSVSHLYEDVPLPSTISNETINAAIDFVEVCCQHTACISGRGLLQQELDSVNAGLLKSSLFCAISIAKIFMLLVRK